MSYCKPLKKFGLQALGDVPNMKIPIIITIKRGLALIFIRISERRPTIRVVGNASTIQFTNHRDRTRDGNHDL